MSEQEDKTPEQVSDEDYKVAPTSTDKEHLKKAAGKRAGGDHQLQEEKVQEELKGGVE